MQTINLGKTTIPVLEYALQGNAILGIRDSGKSYTATYMAERLLDNNIPFVAFDPIGVWKNLRLPGKGKAYKVVVAGGDEGDLKLTPKSAPEIVRAAMRENIPLIIDLYDMSLSKADWKSIVQQCVELLLYKNRQYGPRHIFIEEAAEFAPQRIGPDQGRVYAEIEKLARMGGNAQLGYTLINQRAEEVNKAVLELCDCLFLHRQKGRNSLTALGKWLDFINATASKKIIDTMPTLQQGQCWVWAAGSVDPILTSIPAKRSSHPNRRAAMIAGTDIQSIQSTDVSAFIEKMSEAIQQHLEKAHEDDPARLRKRIAELERANHAPAEIIKEIPVAVINPAAITEIKAIMNELNQANDRWDASSKAMMRVVGDLNGRIENVLHNRLGSPPKSYAIKGASLVSKPIGHQPPITLIGNDDLDKAQRSILKVLAMFPNGKGDKEIALLSGYAFGAGRFNGTMKTLRESGYIDGTRQCRIITPAGLAALGDDREQLPTGGDLIQYWRGKLDKAERSAFDVLINIYPNGVGRNDLAIDAGYTPGTGGINSAIKHLKALELIVTDRGFIRINPALFG